MLIYFFMAVMSGVIVGILRTVHPLSAPALATVWILVALVIDRLAGHAPRGRALRPVVGYMPDESLPDDIVPDGTKDIANCKRWYIETPTRDYALPCSCSFVEYDERGDYLDFAQHRHAYQKIMQLAKEARPLTVVVYVHGWRHSGQSDNVIAFNEFLHQLAQAAEDPATGIDAERTFRRRVHGVYLAWRGASLKHPIAVDKTFTAVTGYYGGEIVDVKTRARVPLLNMLLESCSYFDRKSIPEHKFSGTGISRTIFSCALAAKRGQVDSQVLLIGHSFGGLMLERTFQNAAISELTEAWPWGDPKRAGQHINPLPFDTVLIVNSAAPSIYAKQFQSYLAAHRQAMMRAHVRHADTPIVFSLTSSADWATGILHPAANLLCFLLPTLWRKYRGDDFALVPGPASHDVEIPQAYYYRHTPGHNPLLVNRFIEQVTSLASGEQGSQVRHNLAAPSGRINEFKAATRTGSGTLMWRVNFPPETAAFKTFSSYRGLRPLAWTDVKGRYIYKETAYWIIRCPKEIIAGHNDIWSQAAMDTYAALHRIALEANAA
jgi:hypothetical protein